MGLGFLLFLFLFFQFGIADARVIDGLQLLFEHFLYGSDVFEGDGTFLEVPFEIGRAHV